MSLTRKASFLGFAVVASLIVASAISHSSSVRADLLGFATVTFFVSCILGVASPEHSTAARKRNDSLDPFDPSPSRRHDHSFDPLNRESAPLTDEDRIL